MTQYTAKLIIALGLIAALPKVQAQTECSVSQGEFSNFGRYNISTSCFLNSGWFPPVPDSVPGSLTTNTNYDYRSGTYSQNNQVAWTHGGVDFVGPTSNPYTTQTPVFSIGDGIVRYVFRSTATSANSSRVHIEHTSKNGNKFLAIYGHVYSNLNTGNTVTKGQNIGSLRVYGSPIHIHFELNTDLATTSYGGVKQGTVNPVQYLINNQGTDSGASDASYFDGTGSLVDPRLTGSSCKRDGVGCSYDLVTLHPHATPSSALFQIVSIPGVCESVELSGLNGGGKVEMRSWAGFGTESVYYTLDSLPATIPLKNQNTSWNLLALTTTSPVPAGSTRTVQAKCVANRTTSSNARIISNGKPLQFGNDNYWGGNGSIMGHTARADTTDAAQGFGRNRDSVTLMRDHSTISSIQVTRGTCSRVKFSTPVPIKVSWKSWSASNWLGSTTVSNQDFLDIPVEVGHWAILMIQAGPTKANNSVVTASCM